MLTDTVYLEAPPFFWQKQPRWKPGTGNCLENVRLLQNQPFILLKPGRGLRYKADQFFREAGIRPRIILETDSVELAHRLAQDNHGFTLIPGLAFRTLHRTERSVFFQVAGHPLDRTLYLVRRKGAYLTRAMEALSTLIRSRVTGTGSMVK